MAALGNIGLTPGGEESFSSMSLASPVWPDVSIALPQDAGSGSYSPETFVAYVSG